MSLNTKVKPFTKSRTINIKELNVNYKIKGIQDENTGENPGDFGLGMTS